MNNQENFEPALEYGRLITIKDKIFCVSRIRLYDGHEYNWSQQLRWNDILYAPTDQTHDLDSDNHMKIDFYDEVWFDGVCIYKKPWYLKLMNLLRKNRT